MSRNAMLWLGAGLVLAVASFFVGRSLHSQTETASAFDQTAAVYAPSETAAGFSLGGFSGFGEVPGFNGRTVIGGRVTAVGSNSITLQTAGGATSTVQVSGSGPLKRLSPASLGDIRTGSSVVVRQTADDSAASILILDTP